MTDNGKAFDIQFVPSGRGKAQCAPDPNYPNGKEIILPITPACIVELPYPAPECGYYLLKCNACESSMAVTAAGRPDDPTRVSVPCMVDLRKEFADGS